jgi:peptide deformylase
VLTDFVARIFQHELDHLDGKVFLDRVESTLDLISEAEYQRQVLLA